MKIRYIFFGIFALLSVSGFAQERRISGILLDRENTEPVIQATVQLLKTDSTFVVGALSDDAGAFSVEAPSNGKYLLKVSSVGYKPQIRQVQIAEDKNLEVGKIAMTADAIMLKEAKVTAQALKVVVKADTFIYNSAAYRTPEGSTIEELVKRLPGASIDDNGKITINGKQVKKILVDGKEFMTGDTKVAMKNLPTSIVERVKAYDQQSDLARVTGIDDGEESTVLDFGLKKGMNKGMFSNLDLSYGTHRRYSEKLMGAWFNDRHRFMLFANANNVNDMGFPGRGGGRFGAGRQGLNSAKMIGLNYNYELRKKLTIDLSGFWNYNDGDAYTKRSSENFVSRTGSFSNSTGQNYTRGNSLNLQGRIEWQPDTMTNIMFRPTFSWSQNDGLTASHSASYNADPYSYVDDPLDPGSLDRLSLDSLVVNSQRGDGISFSSSRNLNGYLQLNRRLNARGRNLTLSMEGGYGRSDSKSLSANATRLYLMRTAAGLDSTYQTNRYNLMPTDNYNYRIQASYSEPLFKGAFLQFRYSFRYNYSKSDRSTYDFSNLGEEFFADIHPAYRGWGDYLTRLAHPIDSYLNDDLSRYSEYRNYIHQLDATFRLVRPKFRLNAGFMVQPQRSKYVQDYQGLHVDTTRTVVNFSPTFDFRYSFSRQHQLRINYRGTTSQPSMSQLLDITDDSNPLDISRGNPGLKPSFTNSFRLDYNNFIHAHTRFIGANLNFSSTRNSISNKVSYDETTGGRTTQPENINGNWNLDGQFMFNTSIDTLGRWNVNTETGASFANNVGYLSLDRMSDSQKNRTRTLNLRETLGGSYRNEWLEVGLDASVNYMHARNKLQSQSNLDTWQFSYGATVTATAPWGMGLSTSIHQNSRRGYNDNSMNTNELIWNAQLSQGILKGNALTVMLQFYDILHRQSNFSRTVNAMQRSDTWYNSINSYAMLHVVYRFNLFGGKSVWNGARGRRGPGGDRPGFGGPTSGGRRPAGTGMGGGRRDRF
ncbi:TonB-dependent receptor [Prevotella sp. KH2C16]|uniref:TonB-dependent receptor n=1 Tax=Prevotella sp. KH2C16 TaxID=1855325 RepID=UPI0008E96D18|nr:TonB-dependent receptor [Prevotella sp. KH2C16]SFG24934.1 CarboxypepD_reg-like domain-containing protein [Prevotella sp. KH2C16]